MQIKKNLNRFAPKIVLTLVSLAALATLTLSSFLTAKADNPTFFFSASSGCGSAITSLEAGLGNALTLYLCIDAENEGQGLLGAETHIGYSSSDISISNINCNVFDTCIDLSESATIKLLAASGPLPDGQAATTQREFGHFSLTPKTLGSHSLSFTLAQIINENEAVESRSGVGVTIQVVATEEEVSPEEEPPVEEIVNTPDEVPGEEGENVEETPAPDAEEPAVDEPTAVEAIPPADTVITSVVGTPLSATAQAGDVVQIASKAYYSGGRPSENITSCFPCPTANNPSNGTTAYHIVSGPGTFSGSKIVVNSNATPDQVIVFNTHYTDNVSGSSGLSGNSSITIVSEMPEENAPEEEAEVPTEENPATEEPTEVTTPEEEVIPEEPETEVTPPTKGGEGEDEGEGETAIHEAASSDYEAAAEQALMESQGQQSGAIIIPNKPQDDLCVQGTSDRFDGDQDGLSDRTECYLGTDPADSDSDRDGCWDGEEINRFYSNPLESDDCNIETIANERVLIVDPKANWIVKSFDISGLAPLRSRSVGITAFPALHKRLSPVLTDLETLNSLVTPDETTVARILEVMNGHLIRLNEFLDDYGQEYEGLAEVTNRALNFVELGTDVMTQIEQADTLLSELKAYKTKAIYLGEVRELKEAGIGQKVMAGFRLIPDSIVEDGAYDLVATALLDDGRHLSSAPMRVTLDSMISVPAPTPESLDGVTIRMDGSTLRVGNGRPVLSGQSAYGTQLFATWESLILASSIITDSNEGSFNIQSPRELEKDMGHTVSLYAVSQQERGMVRSETAIVDFSVVPPSSNYSYWIIGLLALMAIAGVTAKRRMLRIDRVAPEHRTKENELYEAFGLETPREETIIDHSPKQKEVEAAFGGETEE